MITKDELEKLWRSARTSEQLDRYYELRRERDAATQRVLMVCARCHCGFQRLPQNALCRFCQGHSARRTIAENVLATLPGCTGVAAICSTSADEYECAGPHGSSAAQVARLLGGTGWEYAQVRTDSLLFEAVRRQNQVLAVATSDSKLSRGLLERSVSKLNADIEAIRCKVS